MIQTRLKHIFNFHFFLNFIQKCRTIELSDYRALGLSICTRLNPCQAVSCCYLRSLVSGNIAPLYQVYLTWAGGVTRTKFVTAQGQWSLSLWKCPVDHMLTDNCTIPIGAVPVILLNLRIVYNLQHLRTICFYQRYESRRRSQAVTHTHTHTHTPLHVTLKVMFLRWAMWLMDLS